MLSHVDARNRPTMVDVSAKEPTYRTAHARGRVLLPPEVRGALHGGDIDSPKGPVFHTAIVAGVMAAKRTSELIPFCHPLALEDCRVAIAVDPDGNLKIDCRVALTGRTGVEMEALTGVTAAALTVYDMCKALSHEIVIADVRLVRKTGGKHG